ncbi:hypothetical protein L7F22_047839 [Adiantum nelumboides]|nr:hypothetical protein [Adiantum nelumboides]
MFASHHDDLSGTLHVGDSFIVNAEEEDSDVYILRFFAKKKLSIATQKDAPMFASHHDDLSGALHVGDSFIVNAEEEDSDVYILSFFAKKKLSIATQKDAWHNQIKNNSYYVEGHFYDKVNGCSNLAGNLARSGISKRWSGLHPDWQKIINPCKFHENMHCHLVENDIGLLVFYNILPLPVGKGIPLQISQAEEDQEVIEIETNFQEEEEKLESKDILDIARFKVSNITKVEDLDVEERDHDPLKCTTTFPTYKFNQKEYVLLNDIQHLFDLREDYALAILAEWASNDKGFISYSPCLLAVLDTEAENFINSSKAGKHVLDIVLRYEPQVEPSEEEFKEIKKRLKIDYMGQEKIRDPPKVKPTSAIDIWEPTLFEEDETPRCHLWGYNRYGEEALIDRGARIIDVQAVHDGVHIDVELDKLEDATLSTSTIIASGTDAIVDPMGVDAKIDGIVNASTNVAVNGNVIVASIDVIINASDDIEIVDIDAIFGDPKDIG